MTTVTISVEGLSLWIRRKKYWEVLFPTCKEPTQQHCPYLSIITNGGAPAPKRESLEGVTMTTVGLIPGAAPATQAPSWMLKMSASDSSAAGGKNPASARGVFATLQLPLQLLERKSARDIGPVSFNGEMYQLDYGTSIRLTAAEPAFLIKTKDGVSTPINLDTSVPTIMVVIENLTDKDQEVDCGETKKGEHLEETDDLLALCDMPVAVPRYFGPDLKKVCEGLRIEPRAEMENPYRLCPSAYCVDCPDD